MWRNMAIAWAFLLALGGVVVAAYDPDADTEDELIEEAGEEPNLITFSSIDRAWKYGRGENTRVAVCDWLFDMGSQASAKYIDAASMVPGQEIGSAHPWHGEWMAQIVHQVAPEAKIIPIRARAGGDMQTDPDGRFPYEKYLVQGIRYAADHGAVAVTNSMGPVTQCRELRDAIDYAERKGTIFINVHPERTSDPNAIDRRILHTGLVSVEAHKAVPHPARDIYVWPYQMQPVFGDGWGYSNGPPIVAGAVALIKGVNPDLTPEQVRAIIRQTAEDIDGFMALNAEAAVRKARAMKKPAPAAPAAGGPSQ